MTQGGPVDLSEENARLQRRIAELEAREEEQAAASEALRVAEQEKTAILDTIPELVVYHDPEMHILWVNRSTKGRLAGSNENVLGRHCYEAWHGLAEPCPGCPVALAAQTGQPQEGEMHLPNGSVRYVRGYPLLAADGTVSRVVEVAQDLTQRRQMEHQLGMYQEFTAMANRHSELQPLLQDFVRALREFTGYAALGIRLRDEHDFIPYQAFEGFSSEFYERESQLCLHTDRCLCINVFKGADRSLSYCTANGSLCLNNTTATAATFTDEDWQNLRGHCITVGYHTLVLVPIRLQGNVIGLIHGADPRPDLAPPETITALERIADSLGIAIGRVRAADELRRTSETLARMNRYNRSLIEASLDPLVTIDAQGKISDVNQATEQATGYSREELIGADFSDYFTEPEKARAGYEHVFREGTVRDYELELRHRDGRTISVTYNASLFRDEQGAPLGVFAAARDITERKQAQEALLAANAYNRSLIEVSLDPLVTISPDGHITDVNSATEQATGHRRQELVGTDFSSYFTDPQKARAGYQQVFRDGSVRDYELEMRGADGRTIPVLYNAAVYRNPAGEVAGVFAAARDVSAQRQVEEELQRRVVILTGLNAMASIANESSEVKELLERAIDEAIRLTGVDLVAVRLVDPATGELVLHSYQGIDEALATQFRQVGVGEGLSGRVVQTGRAEVISRSGEDSTALPVFAEREDIPSATCIPLSGSAGMLGVINLGACQPGFFDAIEQEFLASLGRQIATALEKLQLYEAVRAARDQLEQRVVERTAELEAANRELEAFAYSVSHDLRAPLRTIDGFSLAIVEDAGDRLDDDSRRHLQRVRAAAQRMSAYIDGLLGLSRLNRQELNRTPVDLSGVASAIAADLKEMDPDRTAEFVVADGLTANGDAVMLRAVLENLLGNAFKFTAKRDWARIEFGRTDVAGGRAFYVRDNGAGFEMEHAGNLFGPFQRLHRVDEFPGIGIGLATVQRLIARHGGRIWGEGKVGVGATFYFTLPE